MCHCESAQLHISQELSHAVSVADAYAQISVAFLCEDLIFLLLRTGSTFLDFINSQFHTRTAPRTQSRLRTEKTFQTLHSVA